MYEFGGHNGVWLADRPLDINDGFEGDVVLAVDLPDAVFCNHEWTDDAPEGHRMALVPAAVANQHGPAKVYSHDCAGASRRDLLQCSRAMEAEGGPSPMQCAATIQAAIRFFDEIGWQTPLILKEGA